MLRKLLAASLLAIPAAAFAQSPRYSPAPTFVMAPPSPAAQANPAPPVTIIAVAPVLTAEPAATMVTTAVPVFTPPTAVPTTVVAIPVPATETPVATSIVIEVPSIVVESSDDPTDMVVIDNQVCAIESVDLIEDIAPNAESFPGYVQFKSHFIITCTVPGDTPAQKDNTCDPVPGESKNIVLKKDDIVKGQLIHEQLKALAKKESWKKCAGTNGKTCKWVKPPFKTNTEGGCILDDWELTYKLGEKGKIDIIKDKDGNYSLITTVQCNYTCSDCAPATAVAAPAPGGDKK